jgi:hypothetical protein
MKDRLIRIFAEARQNVRKSGEQTKLSLLVRNDLERRKDNVRTKNGGINHKGFVETRALTFRRYLWKNVV